MTEPSRTHERAHRTQLANAQLVTLEPGHEVREADLFIEGREIVAVGEAPPGWAADERVELSGHAVLPALWNAHTHAAMTFTRSIGDDLPLDRWFNERVWVAESGLREDDVYWGAMLACAEMIRGGTAGFADHYFYMHRVAQVVEDCGMKALLATAVFGTGREIDLDADAALAWARDNDGRADGRIRTALGPHSPYICPEPFLRAQAEAAASSGLPLHIHVAESEDQVRASLREHGKSPVAYLRALGILAPGTLAAHCIAIDDEDIALLADSGAAVVQCPRCHAKLGMGTTPVSALLDAGVPVALGTDGAASNNKLDMLAEVQQSALLEKLLRRDPARASAATVLGMGTRVGARAMGFADSGAIRPGAAADLAIVDLQRPHLQPLHALLGALLYAASAADVVRTMVDGRWLMRDRELLTLDEAQILAEAPARARAMLGRGQELTRRYSL